MRLRTIRSFQLPAFILYGVVAAIPLTMTAQTLTKAPTAIRFTATTENVSGAGEPIKINLSNWSTDADRDQMVAAWTLSGAPAEGRGGRGGRGGGGGGRGGRGGGAQLPADPDAVDPDNPAIRFGRGGARGRGAADPDAPTATPQASLSAALKKAQSVGILWTSETVGYSIKYAYRLPQADGSDRIILATERRVGAWSNLWKPAGSVNLTDYDFSIIELRVNPKGEGEGRASMTGKIAVDSEAKTIGLDGYSTLPVVFKGVKRQN